MNYPIVIRKYPIISLASPSSSTFTEDNSFEQSIDIKDEIKNINIKLDEINSKLNFNESEPIEKKDVGTETLIETNDVGTDTNDLLDYMECDLKQINYVEKRSEITILQENGEMFKMKIPNGCGIIHQLDKKETFKFEIAPSMYTLACRSMSCNHPCFSGDTCKFAHTPEQMIQRKMFNFSDMQKEQPVKVVGFKRNKFYQDEDEDRRKRRADRFNVDNLNL